MEKTNFMLLRRLHGRIYEASLKRKTEKSFQCMVKRAYKKSIKEEAINYVEDYPVDFVVLWLDGNDPNWIREMEKYQPKDSIAKKNNSAARFRNWDNFHYWFRSVEKYAPWVRYVYVVTWGHVPEFLDLSNPKIRFIRHDQFMPAEYLPTFSCFPTELNLWRIEGISEHIVYFNDDFFLTKPLEKSDFFKNGLPRYCGIPSPTYPKNEMTAWWHNLYNTAGVANAHFDIKQCIVDHPEKWFCSAYGKKQKHVMRAYEDGKIMGMFYSHLGIPYRCSTMKKVWDVCFDRLDKTCRNKFRTMDDVFHQIFEMWEVFCGTYDPVSLDYYGYTNSLMPSNLDVFKEAFLGEKNRMVCPNDWEGITEEEFEHLKRELLKIMQEKYPEKSSFEK